VTTQHAACSSSRRLQAAVRHLLTAVLLFGACLTPLPAPGPVVLVAPPDGAVLRSAEFLLDWEPAEAAAAYQVQLSARTTFATPLIDTTLLPDSARLTLATDGAYYWRVRPLSLDSVLGEWTTARRLDLTRFTLVTAASSQGYPHDVALQGDRAYVAQGQAGLAVYDISTTESPRLLGAKMDSLNEAWGVAVRDTIAYLAYGYKELVVMNVARPESIRVTGVLEYPQPGYGYDIALTDSFAWVAANSQFLRVEVADPRYPNLVQQAYYPRDCRGVAAGNGFVYLALGQLGIAAWDTRTTPPAQVGAMDTPGFARGLTAVGNTLYVADGREGLLIVDVTDAAHPVRVAALDLSGYANTVTVADTLAYVACGDGGLSVVNVARAAEPVLVARVPLGYCMGVAVRGSHVFAGDRDLGLVVIRQED
jgi:hypothetical protein